MSRTKSGKKTFLKAWSLEEKEKIEAYIANQRIQLVQGVNLAEKLGMIVKTSLLHEDEKSWPALIVDERSEKQVPLAIIESKPRSEDDSGDAGETETAAEAQSYHLLRSLPFGEYSWARPDQFTLLTYADIRSELDDSNLQKDDQRAKAYVLALRHFKKRYSQKLRADQDEKERAKVMGPTREPEDDVSGVSVDGEAYKMNNPGKASELKKANRKKKKLAKKSKRSDTNKNNAKPQPQDKIELPTSPVNHTIPLHLRLSDLSHAGVKAFLNTVFRSSDIPQTLDQCLKNVRKLLYPPELADALAGAEIREKEVRSITLVIRDMEGVAYTTGNQLDDAHKEIHLSANYILSVLEKACKTFCSAPEGSGEPPTPDDAIKHAKDEVIGVIVHEMVHTVQHDGKGTAPGGFIEGAADWVRALACGPAAHWDIYAIGKKWDEGYQRTAYFLRFASEFTKKPLLVPMLNQTLMASTWDKKDEVFERVSGKKVSEAWEAYKVWVKKQKRGREKKPLPKEGEELSPVQGGGTQVIQSDQAIAETTKNGENGGIPQANKEKDPSESQTVTEDSASNDSSLIEIDKDAVDSATIDANQAGP